MYRQTNDAKTETRSKQWVSSACAAAAFILILRTLSLSLSVLLVTVAVLGILIRLALTRLCPWPERS